MISKSGFNKRITPFTNYFTLFFILFALNAVLLSQTVKTADNPDPARFAQDIETFINWDQKNAVPDNAILFVGSSSIRMWKTRDSFPDFPVINRGFGGSHISDVIFFMKDVVLKYNPEIIIFYAGDNDIAGSKSPQQVFEDYVTFIKNVKEKLPDVRIVYIPIKPSIARWNMWPDMKKTNKLIMDYSQKDTRLFYADTATPMLGTDGKPETDLFLDDGLHLNDKGYELWNGILYPVVEEILKQ
ncbi:hypothetical protein JXQ31_05465 [candidate division KSB1 bacterium]|nr:hypothetical protein [candidate division KSB1 bacterium]